MLPPPHPPAPLSRDLCVQPQGPCLRLLSDEEAVEHLWTGPRSVARRILRGCVQALAPAAVAREFGAALEDDELQAAVQEHAGALSEGLAKMAGHVLQPVSDFAVRMGHPVGGVGWRGASRHSAPLPCTQQLTCSRVRSRALP